MWVKNEEKSYGKCGPNIQFIFLSQDFACDGILKGAIKKLVNVRPFKDAINFGVAMETVEIATSQINTLKDDLVHADHVPTQQISEEFFISLLWEDCCNKGMLSWSNT